MTRVSLLACAFLATILGGCDVPFGVEGEGRSWSPELQDRVAVEPGLEVRLFSPDTVAAADSFDVRLRVENRAGRAVGLQTPTSCLFTPGVYSGDERIEMKGSLIGCFQAVTTREIPPGKGRARVYDMQAVLTGSEDDRPASPGDYTIKVELDWTVEGRGVEETLKAPLSVVEPE